MKTNVTKTEGTGSTLGYATLNLDLVGPASVKVTVPDKDMGAVKAYASLTIKDTEIGDIVISGMKVLEGEKGEFVSMPNRKGKDDKYYDIAFPTSAEGRKSITDLVLEAYHNVNAQGKGEASGNISGEVVVNGVKILTGANGTFVSMPQRQGNDGEYHDIVFPISAEGRKAIADAVMAAYNA